MLLRHLFMPKKLYPYDLQAQSRYSDGDDAPSEIARQARKLGLRGVAITDHNTTDGIRKSVRALRKLGLIGIEGIEVSCGHQGDEIHILGYANKFILPPLEQFTKRIRRWYQGRAKFLIAQAKEKGYLVESYNDLAKGRRGHGSAVLNYDIARMLVRKNHLPLSVARENIRAWLSSIPAALSRKHLPHPRIAIQAIHRAGGVAILAHPGRRHTALPPLFRMISEIRHFGIDGIEIFSPRHSQEQIKALTRFGEKNGLVITGGSDYHGKINQPELSLGCGGLTEKYFKLFERALLKSANLSNTPDTD